MEIDNLSVGRRIKKIRSDKRESTAAFAERFTPKASNSLVSRWERGVNLPNAKRLKTIAETGGISVSELLYGNLNNYSLNVIIQDIKDKGSLWEKFKLHYIRFNELDDFPPSNEELESIAIDYVNENFSKIYEIMLKNQQSMYANTLMNSNEELLEHNRSLAKEKLIDYGREKEILMYAQYAIGQLLPFDTTYEESRELVVAKLKELPFFGTVYSYDELFERNIEQGMDETSAKIKAFNQFYKSELFGKVHDLETDIKKLDEEAQIKKEQLTLLKDNQD